MKAGRRNGMIAVFMLSWCTFRQQMGRPVLKLTAVLSHTQKVNNLAMLYCCLEVERFPTIRRRRFLDGIPKSAERVCVLSQGQLSLCCPKQVLQYPDQSKKPEWCRQREGTGWHVVYPSGWPRPGSAVTFLQLMIRVCRALWLIGAQIHL